MNSIKKISALLSALIISGSAVIAAPASAYADKLDDEIVRSAPSFVLSKLETSLSAASFSTEQSSIDEVTQHNIVYSLFDGHEAHVKDGSAVSGTVQIPDAVYANGTYYIVKKIETSAFEGNNNIKAVDMQYASGLTEFENRAFRDCKNLETVALPFNLELTAFVSTAFGGCESLREFVPVYGKNFNIVDGVLYTADMTKVFRYPPAKSGDSFTLENGVSIGFKAFEGAKYLQNLNVPEELNESTAESILKKYQVFVKDIESMNISINGVSVFHFPENDFEAPSVDPIFRGVVADVFNVFTDKRIDHYTKCYVNYVVKTVIKDGDTDLEKALKLHDWLCERVKYDPVVSACLARKEIPEYKAKNHCDASAFIHYENAGKDYSEAGYYTVCDGYARAYKLLLNAAGVCCERVSGSATANEITGHAWNVVMLNAHDDDPSNDRCYYVDTTWDDNANGYGYDNFMRSVDNDFPDHSTKYCNWEIEGNFNEIELTSIPEKSYSIWTIGDINGDSYVTGADLFILREYENSNDWTDDMRANADVNFDGIINENDVEILSFFIDARLGDINNSGNIDEYDYLSLKHYLERPQDIGSYMKVSADVNMDGSYDDRDLEALKSLFGRSCEKVNYYFNQYCFEKIQQKIK